MRVKNLDCVKVVGWQPAHNLACALHKQNSVDPVTDEITDDGESGNGSRPERSSPMAIDIETERLAPS